MSQDPEPGLLRWKCRRGMRELDVLLSRFLEDRYPTLSRGLKADFAALLEWQDPELFSVMLGRAEPGEEFAEIVRLVRDHASG